MKRVQSSYCGTKPSFKTKCYCDLTASYHEIQNTIEDQILQQFQLEVPVM